MHSPTTTPQQERHRESPSMFDGIFKVFAAGVLKHDNS